MAKARNLIFFGYSGSREPSGPRERDTSFFLVAQTLTLHLQRRFPDDVIEIVCAWHKDVFVNKLRVRAADPGVKIRQIHYVGHGAGGGLYFGYHNAARHRRTDRTCRHALAHPAASRGRQCEAACRTQLRRSAHVRVLQRRAGTAEAGRDQEAARAGRTDARLGLLCRRAHAHLRHDRPVLEPLQRRRLPQSRESRVTSQGRSGSRSRPAGILTASTAWTSASATPRAP